MNNEENRLQKAIELRNEKQLKESNELLLELVQLHPENAYYNYQCAWSFDCLGEESKAVPYYAKAIQGGLEETDLVNAFLGFGSTLRSLGEYERSKDVLQEAVERFPTNQALRVFFAMTLYNVDEHRKAMEFLLKCIAETSSNEEIQKYKRAIAFYSEKLDETWV